MTPMLTISPRAIEDVKAAADALSWTASRIAVETLDEDLLAKCEELDRAVEALSE